MQRISIHLGIYFTVTVKPVQFEFCLRNIHLPMQPFMQDATPPGAQPLKYLSKNAHKYLLAGLAMVGTYG